MRANTPKLFFGDKEDPLVMNQTNPWVRRIFISRRPHP
jgi:hypothetical protein